LRGRDRLVMAAAVAAIVACLGRDAQEVRVRGVRPLAPAEPDAARGTGALPPLWALAGRQAQMAARRGPCRCRKGGAR